ncbi:MAG TPA: glycosyltransferase family 87 protein [Candidatus Binatia bacterium]|nr:glycosyltransferase family 87 protein [Candidatus Binatia bacterium]
MIGLWQLVCNTLLGHPNFADWSCFWAGGATAGTRALLDPNLHAALAQAHGIRPAIWAYLPAFAWLFVPAAHFSLFATYVANAIAMLGIAAYAGIVLADSFEMPRWFGVIAVLAWAPVKIAAVGGQNTPIALLLIALAIAFAKAERPAPLGACVGLLLYKPTIALPFIVLLMARREWRALAVVAACGAAWYFASVAAAGGNWLWMRPYLSALHWYFPLDFRANAANVVSLPGILMRFGMPAAVALGIAVALFVAALPRLARIDTVAALSVTSALAVALSPHAWQYEPVIMLPAIFYAMLVLSDPLKTWLVAVSYVVAVVSIFAIPGLSWNLLVIVVIGLTVVLLWNVTRRRTSTDATAQHGFGKRAAFEPR